MAEPNESKTAASTSAGDAAEKRAPNPYTELITDEEEEPGNFGFRYGNPATEDGIQSVEIPDAFRR